MSKNKKANLEAADNKQSVDAVDSKLVGNLVQMFTWKSSTQKNDEKSLFFTSFLRVFSLKKGGNGATYRLVPSKDPPCPVQPPTSPHLISLIWSKKNNTTAAFTQ